MNNIFSTIMARFSRCRHKFSFLLWGSFIVGVLFCTPTFLLSTDKEPVARSKITGNDETYNADVILKDARHALVTDATVTIEQLFGRDAQATSWVYVGEADDADGVGAAGDTVRIQIPAAATPLNALYPAVDVTTTVTAGMVSDSNPERALATAICVNLNGNSNFQLGWKCQVIKDYSGVFIYSRIYNEWGERTSWTVTTTGTTVMTMAYADIIRRGFPTELARSPNNPRQGILAISGSVSVTPGDINEIFQAHLRNSSNSEFMNINGSVTNVAFAINCDSVKDLYIQTVKIFGNANGIKFGKFFNISPLTNGILIQIRSNGATTPFTEDPVYTTDDLKHHFTNQLSNFELNVQAGRDDLAVFRTYENPFVIKKCGTNGTSTDDFLKATVRDNLSSLLDLQMAVAGFKKEP